MHKQSYIYKPTIKPILIDFAAPDCAVDLGHVPHLLLHPHLRLRHGLRQRARVVHRLLQQDPLAPRKHLHHRLRSSGCGSLYGKIPGVSKLPT